MGESHVERGRRGTVRAEAANEPLRQGGAHGRGDEVWFRPHVDEAGQGSDSSVSVIGGEDEVAGKRGLDRDRDGLAIADLADHHHVGVLAQDRP
jgi:hypothetical protein